MKISEVRQAYRSQPFRPFYIRVADGREYLVRHPEFLAFRGRTLVVFGPDDVFEIIDTAMIASIHVGNGNKRKRPKKRK